MFLGNNCRERGRRLIVPRNAPVAGLKPGVINSASGASPMIEYRRVSLSFSDYLMVFIIGINIIVGVNHLRSIAKSLEVIASPPAAEQKESPSAN